MKTRLINYKRWFTALALIAAGGMVFGMWWYAGKNYEEKGRTVCAPTGWM